jgi:hypothetical protein
MSEGQNSKAYSKAIWEVIDAGTVFLGKDQGDQEDKLYAAQKFAQAVDKLSTQTITFHNASSVTEGPFVQASADMQAGYLLIEIGHAVETGDNTGVRSGLARLKAENEEITTGQIVPLFFEADLLEEPTLSGSDEEALKIFKERAKRTLDNMVLEARDVIKAAVDKFKENFDRFASELGDLAKSLSAQGAGGIIKAGLEKVISGLKMLAEFLRSDSLKAAIGYVGEAVKNFDLQHLLATAFRSESTKETIERIELRPPVDRAALRHAGVKMAELSSRYVVLLKRARWVLAAVGVVGGMLVLTGVAAHYAALALPITYAVVTVATVLIGMDFADERMRTLIGSL